jgi:ADP-heptose:LPS heptosyltransferase
VALERRIVVLRALGLGDLLTAAPALRALRRGHPSSTITLCMPAALAPLAGLTGAVDDVHDAQPLEPLGEELADSDLGVNLHGRGPESHRVLEAIRPQQTIAFRHPSVGWSHAGPEWRADEHEVLRWCRLLESSGLAADPHDLYLEVPGVVRDDGLTLIHPGAASRSRRWPAPRFAAVARDEAARGRRVLVTGGARERELGRRVAEMAGLPSGAVVAGRTSLMDLTRLVAAAGRLVCGDTGVAHLATAFRTPSVLLFGPVSPALWGPLDPERHVALWAGVTGDPHGGDPDPGLLLIQVEQVLEAIDSLEPARPFTAAASGAGSAHGV